VIASKSVVDRTLGKNRAETTNVFLSGTSACRREAPNSSEFREHDRVLDRR
jgi:hypothetical protein